MSRGLLSRWRTALCLSNDVRDALRACMYVVDELLRWPQLSLAAQKRLLAHDGWADGYRLLQALGHIDALAGIFEALRDDVDRLLQTELTPERLLSGEDLLAMGLPPGPRVGRLLEAVYDAQLESRVSTRDEAIALVREMLEEN